jgi:hypothetical protein
MMSLFYGQNGGERAGLAPFREESSKKSPKNLLGGENSSGERMKLTIPARVPPFLSIFIPSNI